jgi:hypothetical protein
MPGAPLGPLVAHDDHVVVLEAVRRLIERRQQGLLALEHARGAAEDIVVQPALDAGELQNCREVGREVAAQYA